MSNFGGSFANFGNKPAVTTGFSVGGNQQQPAATSTGFGNFGGMANASSGGFGFGNKQSTASTGYAFGNGMQQQSQAIGFGVQPNNLSLAPDPVFTIIQGYSYILQNSNQDNSVFTCVMFNYVAPNLRDEYLRDEKNRLLYGRYLKENPDPANMVPVHVYGFDGLKKRMEEQKKVLKTVKENVDMFQRAITETRVMVTTCDRLARQCDSRQRELEEKMIRVLGKVEAKSSRSQVVVTNETFIENLVRLQRQVTLPAGLRSILSAIYNSMNTYGVRVPEKSLQLENADDIMKFLENQEQALEKVVHILKQSNKELELLVNDPFVHVIYGSKT